MGSRHDSYNCLFRYESLVLGSIQKRPQIQEIHVRFSNFQKTLETTRKLSKSELITLPELRERSNRSSLPKLPKIYQNLAARKNQDPIEKCEHFAKITI